MHAELATSAGGQNADPLRRLASAAAAPDPLKRPQGRRATLAIDAVVIPPRAAPPARVVAPDGVTNGRHKDAEVTMMPPAEIVTVPQAGAMPAATTVAQG